MNPKIIWALLLQDFIDAYPYSVELMTHPDLNVGLVNAYHAMGKRGLCNHVESLLQPLAPENQVDFHVVRRDKTVSKMQDLLAKWKAEDAK